MSGTAFLFAVAALSFVVLIVIASIRAIIGPRVPDRVVALDTINTLVVAVLISLSAAFKSFIYVDIAIVYALLSFVATLFISDYIAKSRGASE